MKNKIFYGWYIAAFAFLTNFMAVGSGFYIFNAFMEPLCKANDWTRTDVNIALVIGMFFGVFSQLLYGTLVVRIGPRRLMLIGPFISGIAFIFLFRAHELWVFYGFCVLLFVGNGAYGGIVSNTAVSNWFENKRGRALGISTTGVSLSGAVLPFIAMMMIMKSGLSGASLQIGIMIAMIGPLAWLIVRDWPEKYGLAPDGAPLSDKRKEVNQAEDLSNAKSASDIKIATIESKSIEWNFSSLIRTWTFWRLGLAFGFIMVGVVGVMSQLKPRFVDVGFSDMAAMSMMATTAFIGAMGKFFWGTLCDRFDPRKVVALLILLNAFGLSFSLIHGKMWALILFIVIYGFSMGGVMSTYPIIIADLFGRKSFPVVMKYVSMFLIIEVAGYIISGQSFDRTGSYDLAYMIFIGLFLVAMAFIITIKRPRIQKGVA